MSLGQPALLGISFLSLAAALTACAPERDPIEANELLSHEDQGAVAVLSPDEGDEAKAAMRAAFEGTPVERPTQAADGVRWSDVPAAAYWGALEVEMAIVRSAETPEGLRFELVTVREEPATLLVERVDAPERIRATATVGTFGQRTDDARALEVAFRTALEAFGRKPSFGK
jgi:hypothetical protein